ncbi:MAG: hypothetical protein ACK5U4_20305 [Rhodospirillales bacterium]|jgi:hypothetical protein
MKKLRPRKRAGAVVVAGMRMGKTSSFVTPSKIYWADVVAPLTEKRTEFNSTDIVTKKGESA